jgi:hypothetical protein
MINQDRPYRIFKASERASKNTYEYHVLVRSDPYAYSTPKSSSTVYIIPKDMV